MKPKLTRQGVRDLGYSPKPQRRELPEQQQQVCPHLEFVRDRFGNQLCKDCGAVAEKHEAALW